MSIKNPDERKFYEIESIENNWSLRELNRQFDSALYERLVLSRDKKGVKKLAEKGQMQMYRNIYDREIKAKDKNPTVGLILCKEKHDLVVKYTLSEENEQIFAKEYQLYLPKKEELEAQVRKALDE